LDPQFWERQESSTVDILVFIDLPPEKSGLEIKCLRGLWFSLTWCQRMFHGQSLPFIPYQDQHHGFKLCLEVVMGGKP